MNSIPTKSFKGSCQQTQSGTPYYKSNTGTIGKEISKPKYIGAMTLCMIPFGIVMGKIADYFSNKDAYKNT